MVTRTRPSRQPRTSHELARSMQSAGVENTNMPGTLHDAFVDELRDMYDAEKQLVKALPKLAKAANSTNLRTAFETHLRETEGHVERLERAFEAIGEKPRGKHCDGIEGIID